jgi:phosphoglucomutase
LLSQWKEKGKLTGKQYVVKTIVTTELIAEMAKAFEVELFDVLTGFKYIAEKIKENEGKKTFIGGGEESYGYLAGEFVRDKDAVMACALLAEASAWAKDQGKTMLDLLLDIYTKFGLYKESLINVSKKGKEGAEEIQLMMNNFRANPPRKLDNTDVLTIFDYQKQIATNLKIGTESPILLPKSNVLQFLTSDGAKITVRPSGTEPKIKFYFSVKGKLNSPSEYVSDLQLLDARISRISKDLGL